MTFALADLKWGTPTAGTESGTIYWSADLSDDLLFDETLYDRSDFEAALQEAFDTWEIVASVDFERADDPADADLTVDMAPLAGSTVGLATYSYRVLPGMDQLVEASVDMDATEEWAPYGETDLNFYAVLVHEIGHALGLEHVNDSSEIMNPVISVDRLGDGDIAGIRTLYGADPEDTTTPPEPGTGAITTDPGAPTGPSGPPTAPLVPPEDDPPPPPDPAPLPDDLPPPPPDPTPPPDDPTPPPPDPTPPSVPTPSDPVPPATPMAEDTPEDPIVPASFDNEDDDGPGGIFGALFGWIFELFGGLFGGDDDDDEDVAAASPSEVTAEMIERAEIVTVVHDGVRLDDGADYDHHHGHADEDDLDHLLV